MKMPAYQNVYTAYYMSLPPADCLGGFMILDIIDNEYRFYQMYKAETDANAAGGY